MRGDESKCRAIIQDSGSRHFANLVSRELQILKSPSLLRVHLYFISANLLNSFKGGLAGV